MIPQYGHRTENINIESIQGTVSGLQWDIEITKILPHLKKLPLIFFQLQKQDRYMEIIRYHVPRNDCQTHTTAQESVEEEGGPGARHWGGLTDDVHLRAVRVSGNQKRGTGWIFSRKSPKAGMLRVWQ